LPFFGFHIQILNRHTLKVEEVYIWALVKNKLMIFVIKKCSSIYYISLNSL
jgi:hypothetical protein